MHANTRQVDTDARQGGRALSRVAREGRERGAIEVGGPVVLQVAEIKSKHGRLPTVLLERISEALEVGEGFEQRQQALARTRTQ